ncbi:hypothetical protein HMPREF9004_0990 [Schaalia cardiffensis F0333]|uniref:Uncharacterized protein n=1 Tax=Schaalia cardiffensis F0333 TaxID=888050 RepID=N6X3W9_9ACTO|nr:hypothetical protein HMPREF9004_0990 [Schaalia cardiffensis F0333]
MSSSRELGSNRALHRMWAEGLKARPLQSSVDRGTLQQRGSVLVNE